MSGIPHKKEPEVIVLPFFKSKLLKKTVLTCMILGTVPSVVIGTFSYYKASSMIQSKVDEGCVNRLQQVQMSVEMQLTSQKKTLLQLIESPSVTQSAGIKKSGFEFEAFERIENVINSLPSASIPVYNVSLINMGQQWVVDKAQIYSLDEYEQLNPSVASYIQNPQKSFWNDDSRVLDSTGKVLANCVSVVQKYQSCEGSYIGTIDIPYDGFKNLIKTTSSSGITMLVSAEGKVIYSDRPEQSGTFSPRMISMIRKSGKEGGSFELKTDGPVWNVTYLRSDYNQWYYVLATPMDAITQDSHAIQWFTFLVCLTLSLLIVFASFLISCRAYRPIQRLSDNLEKQAGAGPLIPGDEVKQIEATVGRLITDHGKLQKQLLSQSEKLREYFVSTLLSCESSDEFIKSKTELYGFPCPPPTMAVMVVQPDSLKGTPYRESDEDILLYAISNIVSEMFGEHAVVLSSILDGRQVTILSVEEEEYKDLAYQYAGQIRQTLRRELEFGVSISISRPIASYGDLHKNYIECVHILQYRILGSGTITFAEDANKHFDFHSVYPQELEEEILDSVKTCDRVKCGEMLHQFLSTIFGIQANRCIYKVFLLRLTVNLMSLGDHEGGDLCRSESEYIKAVYNMHGQDQIEDWLLNTVAESVIRDIEKSEDSHLRQICNAVLEIVRNEYSSKLTLETCAQRLNYHPSYIRHALKKEMGINFRDYLLQYQINVAKKWLVETEYSVTDIARKLQYENTENFIRAFKKAVGCTPRQYKNSRGDR